MPARARASDHRRTVFAVGDEKQSIYGFQGAAPEQFAAMGATFRATRRSRRTALEPHSADRVVSHRRADPGGRRSRVRRPARVRGLTASGEAVRHAANRIGMAGRIEIWDTEKPEKAADAPIWRRSKSRRRNRR